MRNLPQKKADVKINFTHPKMQMPSQSHAVNSAPMKVVTDKGLKTALVHIKALLFNDCI